MGFSCSIRLLFQYAGWPLCVHEKIVIQLASLDWWILRPEDFYLQAVLYLRKSPWIIVKCLAKDKHNVRSLWHLLPCMPLSLHCGMAELPQQEMVGITLENCLLATDGEIF